MRGRMLLLLAALFVVGCAAKPLYKAEGTTAVTPAEAARTAAAGTRVIWGGVIVATTNLKEATQLEILAYPLAKNQEPDTDKTPLGRFLAVQPGYLESADYTSGRRITLVGTLSGTRRGAIGETEYTYPIVAPEKMHLWPRERAVQDPSSRLHFGVGVGVIFR